MKKKKDYTKEKKRRLNSIRITSRQAKKKKEKRKFNNYPEKKKKGKDHYNEERDLREAEKGD